jgi:DNA-directed RNA polymerase specialized sigma24 family protein
MGSGERHGRADRVPVPDRHEPLPEPAAASVTSRSARGGLRTRAATRSPAADERDALARALARLPERQRSAIVLTELLGYDSEEAGRILGVKDVTVRSLASASARGLADPPGGP